MGLPTFPGHKRSVKEQVKGVHAHSPQRYSYIRPSCNRVLISFKPFRGRGFCCTRSSQRKVTNIKVRWRGRRGWGHKPADPNKANINKQTTQHIKHCVNDHNPTVKRKFICQKSQPIGKTVCISSRSCTKRLKEISHSNSPSSTHTGVKSSWSILQTFLGMRERKKLS